jgi:hypothetical protein
MEQSRGEALLYLNLCTSCDGKILCQIAVVPDVLIHPEPSARQARMPAVLAHLP